MTVEDELQFWKGCWNQARKKIDQERAKGFTEALEPLATAFRQLDRMELPEAEDVLETAHVVLDDLWKLDEFHYPQQRMEHLMEVIGMFSSVQEKRQDV
ncbi:Cytoplasmic dynein 2 heavy chain 1 [Homalodisca vitripennis]|nr:Cytoplasmic dynein 2 heavy chain 1 [Homalodisca vitripennis]